MNCPVCEGRLRAVDRKQREDYGCRRNEDRCDSHDRSYDSRGRRSKRRGSWISEIFESFGSN